MKTFKHLTLLALWPVLASAATPVPDTRHQLLDGVYPPTSSNNNAVCPQRLKTSRVDGKLSSIKVVYIGDCYSWGPFEYDCSRQNNGELICSSPSEIEFTIHDREHFLWRNKPYSIWAELRRDRGRWPE